MTEISYNELQNRQQEEQYEEEETYISIKRYWKPFIVVLIIVLWIVIYWSMNTKLTDIDKIKNNTSEIIKLENKLLDNQLKQKTVYKQLKENAKEYNNLLSGANSMNNLINKKKQENKSLILKQ